MFSRTAIVLLILASICNASGYWLDVPFVKQEGKGCGAACISMVMQYWQKGSSDPNRIMQLLYSPKANGIFASDMQKYFQENEFQVFTINGTRSDLEHHLKKGRPLIVCLDENERDSYLHYVVVAGFDPEGQVVYLNDPAEKKMRQISWTSFESQWKRMKSWMLLALPGQTK